MSDEYEWVSKVSRSGGFYYIRLPIEYGEMLHKCRVRVRVTVIAKARKYELRTY